MAVQLSDWKVIPSNESYQLIVFEEKENRKPFSWKKSDVLILGTNQQAIFKKHKQLYLELGDLD